MIVDKDKIVSNIALIKDQIFEEDYLTDEEKLIILCNLILDVSIKHLPTDLKADGTNILSNGKRISYHLLKDTDNIGLQIALKTHLIINLASMIDE